MHKVAVLRPPVVLRSLEPCCAIAIAVRKWLATHFVAFGG